jgi:hypothetical protein
LTYAVKIDKTLGVEFATPPVSGVVGNKTKRLETPTALGGEFYHFPTISKQINELEYDRRQGS